MLDLRWPIGGLFLILGSLLLGYGLAVAPKAAATSAASLNLDAWVGAAMWLFGGLMALAAKLSASRSA